MKNHKKALFTDFYRQVSLNHLSPGRITDYERDNAKVQKEGYVTFTRKIERAVGHPKSMFENPQFAFLVSEMKEKVLVSYKKEAILPAVLVSIMQLQEDKEREISLRFLKDNQKDSEKHHCFLESLFLKNPFSSSFLERASHQYGVHRALLEQ